MAIFVFPRITVGRIIRRAKRLVAGIEKDFSSYDQSEVDAFHEWLVEYVTKETNELYDNFVRHELIDRQNVDRNNVPDIFNNLKQRSINEWEMTLNRAFAGLRDSATQGIQSIYTRVGREILELRKYKSEFSGRRISKLESVPGLTIHRTGIEGGFEYVFKVSSDRAASVRIVNPNSDNPSATGIQVNSAFSGTGMSDLVVDWIQRHFRGVTVRTAPLADVPMSERRQAAFIDKYKMLLIHRGQGVMLYTARMPDWNDQQLLESPKKLLAFVRARRDLRGRVTFGFVQYLRLLFRTIPRNLEREWMKYVIRMFKERELFHIKGGVVHNSAKVCEWCNEKVLDREAYDFVTNSPRLSVHLYHPNCLVPDTLIRTTKGVIPIREVSVECSVDLGFGVSKPVVDVIERQYVGRIVSLGNSFSIVRSTPDHFYLTDYGWLSADDVRIGDRLVNNLFDEGPVFGYRSVRYPDDFVTFGYKEMVSSLISFFSRAVEMATSIDLDINNTEEKVEYPPTNRDLKGSARKGFKKHRLKLIRLDPKAVAVGLRSFLLDSRGVSITSVVDEVLLGAPAWKSEFIHEFLDGSGTTVSYNFSNFFSGSTFFVVDPFQEGFDLFSIFFGKQSLVKQVSHSLYSGSVFDLTVKDTPCFHACQVITHNCRHQAESPPDDYSGRVYTLEDVTRAARRGLLGKLRR